MKVLQNKRHSEDPNVITLIPVLASSNFEKNLHYLLQCGGRESVLPSIKSVVFFLQELCKRSPSNGNGFLELAVETDKKINDIIGDGDEDVDGLLDLKEDLKEINQIIVNRLAISEVKIEKQKKDTRKPPNNFRNIPILPTMIYKPSHFYDGIFATHPLKILMIILIYIFVCFEKIVYPSCEMEYLNIFIPSM